MQKKQKARAWPQKKHCGDNTRQCMHGVQPAECNFAVALALVHAWSNLFFIFIIIVNTLIGIYQEIKAKSWWRSCRCCPCRWRMFWRDGRELEVHPDSVEKGDVLLLKAEM